jgi:hypothetical protein
LNCELRFLIAWGGGGQANINTDCAEKPLFLGRMGRKNGLTTTHDIGGVVARLRAIPARLQSIPVSGVANGDFPFTEGFSAQSIPLTDP